jgi:Ca-activated chloride channel family protein
MEMMPHPFKEDREIFRVGLQGMEHTIESRPPLHLTFLVDVSGSMSSADKLPLAKESMHMLVDTLREDDTVALATYAGNISKILEPTFGDNKKQIHAAIDRLNSGGSTAMSSGLDLAYEMAWKSFEPGAENRVVVLSDGDANVGRTGWTDMLSQIKSYADRGVTMSTIGLGMGNYKDTRMEQLANKGDGNNFYIDSRAQAHRVFVEDFNSSMINIARDVKIQVEFNPEVVQSYRLIGYENRDIADKDFRNDRVDAGEIGAGHNVTALYELVLQENPTRNAHVGVANLRYEKPGADSVATERSWTYDLSQQSKWTSSSATQISFAAATFAEKLRRSPYASEISWSELLAYTKEAKRRGETDDLELIQLIQQASELDPQSTLVQR